MKRVRIAGNIIMVFFLIFGCSKVEKTVTTESGLTYTYIDKGGGDVVEPNHFLVLNIEYRDGNDSIWMSTAENGQPVIFPKKDTALSNEDGSIYEIFYNLVKGDSITLNMNAAQFFLNTYRMPLPRKIPNATMLTFQIGVEEVYNEDEIKLYQKIERLKFENRMEIEKLKQDSIDISLIQEFVKDNGLNTLVTKSGLNYYITKEGDGKKPSSGDRVRVNYTGRVLNGNYFDSSIKSIAEDNGLYNPQREPYKPFEFTIGSGTVIEAWDESLRLLNEGDEATLIIPSKLGYGPRSMGDKIPPFSILVFNIEFIEIVNESNE